MQDVCISFWNEDGSSDMMLKVTDICSTDPSDPTYCATPADIKVDRTKVQMMEKLNHHVEGDVYPEKTWWFFMKCWYDVSLLFFPPESRELDYKCSIFINIKPRLISRPPPGPRSTRLRRQLVCPTALAQQPGLGPSNPASTMGKQSGLLSKARPALADLPKWRI